MSFDKINRTCFSDEKEDVIFMDIGHWLIVFFKKLPQNML